MRFAGGAFSSLSAGDREMHSRMKRGVFPALVCARQHERAGEEEEEGSRGLELAGRFLTHQPGGLPPVLSVLGGGRRAAQVETGMLQGRARTLLAHAGLLQQWGCRYARADSCCDLPVVSC